MVHNLLHVVLIKQLNNMGFWKRIRMRFTVCQIKTQKFSDLWDEFFKNFWKIFEQFSKNYEKSFNNFQEFSQNLNFWEFSGSFEECFFQKYQQIKIMVDFFQKIFEIFWKFMEFCKFYFCFSLTYWKSEFSKNFLDFSIFEEFIKNFSNS